MNEYSYVLEPGFEGDSVAIASCYLGYTSVTPHEDSFSFILLV